MGFLSFEGMSVMANGMGRGGMFHSIEFVREPNVKRQKFVGF